MTSTYLDTQTIQPLKNLNDKCECGAKIERFSVEHQHTNGHFNQIYSYKCGRRDRWSPNFMDWDPFGSVVCPHSEESKKKTRENSMLAVINEMNRATGSLEDKLAFISDLKSRIEDQL